MGNTNIQPTDGKLGVLVVGMCGAVSTTFIAGTLSVRKNLSEPIGSLTQLGTIRLGKRNENRFPKIKDVISLARLEDIEFGGWDIRNENLYQSCKIAQVLNEKDIDPVREELEQLRPMKGVFNQEYVKRLKGEYIKEGKNHWEKMNEIRLDIQAFMQAKQCKRAVVVWAGSTETYLSPKEIHNDLKSFEKAMHENHPDIAPSMIYAYATLSLGIPYINGAPNLTTDIPALQELAKIYKAPILGKDFKTGQTMMKTVLAPMFKTRVLGLNGWFSTNIL